MSETSLTDTIARYFDLIFSVGFAAEAIWFILAKPSSMDSLTWIMLIIYYCLFSVIMAFAFMNNPLLLKFCGFFRGYQTKTISYLFLATMAFADVTVVPCLVFGSLFAAIAIFNLFRLIVKKETTAPGGGGGLTA